MNRKDKYNMTAMMYAAVHGRHECIELITAAGADVNEKGPHSNTALLIAANYYHITCVNVLLEAGVDVNEFRHDGSTSLIISGEHGNIAMVKKLLQAGAHINIFNNRGENALKAHLSCYGFGPNGTAILLYAAGELSEIPDIMKKDIPEMDLKHLCRQMIRKHLILMCNPHLHLFGRIPLLKLDSLLNEYLLYNVSLDD